MTAPSCRLRARVACAALALVALAACSGDPDPVASPSPTPTATATPTPTPTETTPPAPPPPVATLTGTELADGPVLAVKIENTREARPRIGLQQADVVYVEPVEGGLTRLLAVYSTQLPPEVGPVRSAREGDVQILGNYGAVAFAFSGATGITRDALATGTQVNTDEDSGGRGFHRDRSRRAPHSVIGEVPELMARAGGSVPPGDVGFRFGAAPAGGIPTTSVSTSWASASSSFAWSPEQGRWLLAADGTPDVAPDGSQHGAATVVVQSVVTGLSQNRDVNGARTPTYDLVGSGQVVVLRDGVRYDGSWTRPDLVSPTTFTSAAGVPLTFAAGPVWVLIVPNGQAVTVS